MAVMSIQQLNELFMKALQRRIEAQLYDQNSLFDRIVVEDPIEHYHIPKAIEREPTVEEVLNEGLGVGIRQDVLTEWGVKPIRGSWERRYRTNAPYPGDPQPSFTHECYQCGLPITSKDDGHRWKDHAGRTVCDLALVPQDMIDSQSYWTDHQPKPFHGEEEDE